MYAKVFLMLFYSVGINPSQQQTKLQLFVTVRSSHSTCDEDAQTATPETAFPPAGKTFIVYEDSAAGAGAASAGAGAAAASVFFAFLAAGFLAAFSFFSLGAFLVDAFLVAGFLAAFSFFSAGFLVVAFLVVALAVVAFFLGAC